MLPTRRNQWSPSFVNCGVRYVPQAGQLLYLVGDGSSGAICEALRRREDGGRKEAGSKRDASSLTGGLTAKWGWFKVRSLAAAYAAGWFAGVANSRISWTQRFPSLGPDLPKAEFKRLRTDSDNFIKREKQCSPRLKGENVPTMGLERVTSPKPKKAERKHHNH
jgi:hypothetical protein